jgi:integrase
MEYNVTFREKNGSVQAIISYKDSSERWKQKSKQGFKTQKAAKPWISDTVEELEKTIEYIDVEVEKTTFDELFNNYSNHIKLYKKANTIDGYGSVKKNFSSFDKLEVRKITSLDIQDKIDEMVKRKLLPSTIKSYVSKLKVVFDYAVKMRIIKDNPVCGTIMPKSKNVKKKVKALNRSEFEKLLKSIDFKPYYMITLVAGTCGLRIGEILGLTWFDIDEKKSIMNVNKQWKRKENNPVIYGSGDVKSKNSNRNIPIPPNTLEELKQYKKSHPIDISGRIFPYARTDSMCTNLIQTFKHSGYDISIHDLRHTYASTLIGAGLDFKTVAELMGHTVQETINTYSHFTSDMMQKAQDTINAVF